MPQNVLQHKAFSKFYLLETKFYYFWGYPKKMGNRSRKLVVKGYTLLYMNIRDWENKLT